MRLGVLDVGSNTVHLLVVDAHRGAHPTPASSRKSALRLAERITKNGKLSDSGADELVRAVNEATAWARELGCDELMGFATSAVREATNTEEVLDLVRERTGVTLRVLSGEDEARLTFLAARRWYGWSAGTLLLLDIGGGSLELAAGIDENPDVALSLPLGAGRLRRTHLSGDPPDKRSVAELRDWLDEVLAPAAGALHDAIGGNGPDRAVATSKTFRSLARLTGAAPSSAGPRAARTLTDAGLRQVVAFITRMPSVDLGELEGVSGSRAHQLVAGALVAEAAMRALSVQSLDICPWALREGVILRRLDQAGDDDHTGAAEWAGNVTSLSPESPDRRNEHAPSGALGGTDGGGTAGSGAGTGRGGQLGARWSG